MRILLANAHPFLPQIAGGAQSSMHELAQALIDAGHEVAVLGGLAKGDRTGLIARAKMKLSGARVARDSPFGYPVYRGWFPWEGAERIIADFRPDVVCPQSGLPIRIARAFATRGIPVVLYFRNVEQDELDGTDAGTAQRFIANSHFTAARVKALYGVDSTVIYPLFRAEQYRTATSRHFITFINPHPHKGRDMAFALARRCPDYPFLFVKGWPLEAADQALLNEIAAECPNVTVHERTSDMRSIYAQTRLVLAPSQWEEAFGRIAAEAHFSGIPVLARAIGGLPEAVGPGGMLVPADAEIDAWEQALRQLLDDNATYAAASAAAFDYAGRPEIDAADQVSRFMTVCERAIADRTDKAL